MAQDVLKKLRIVPGQKLAVLGLPASVGAFSALEFDRSVNGGGYDVIVSFVFSLEEMKTALTDIVSKNALAQGGRLLFAYPKKDNPSYKTYIGRDEIFPYLDVEEETGYACGTKLKFNTLISLDNTFTVVGLKNERHSPKKPSAPSQRSGDYENKVPQLAALLSGKAAQAFGALTPGYRRDWARYVFSAQTQQTQKNRLEETSRLLAAGHKSIALYRQRKR